MHTDHNRCVGYPTIFSNTTSLSELAVKAQTVISFTMRMMGALLYADIMTLPQFYPTSASDHFSKHGLAFVQRFNSQVVLFFSAILQLVA